MFGASGGSTNNPLWCRNNSIRGDSLLPLIESKLVEGTNLRKNESEMGPERECSIFYTYGAIAESITASDTKKYI